MKPAKMRALLALVLALATLSTISSTPASAATIFTFTNAGATGVSGPNQSQINTAYASTPLNGLVTITTQGIQEWQVPATGEYWLEFAGASGGYTPAAVGGKGRVIRVKATLTAGNVLKILVGQEGGREYFSTGYAGGGGGGTFIYNSTSSAFIGVAGGGGGAAQGNSTYVSTQPGVDAPAYNVTSGTAGTSYSGSYAGAGAGGTNGGAGTTQGSGSGAGINTNGSNGGYGGMGGTRFAAGGTGGVNGKTGSVVATTDVAGGFGGGGGAGIYNPYEAIGGGGGGYSGGGSGATRVGAGGAGGNFYTGIYTSTGLNTGNGYVTIEAVGPSLNTFTPRSTLTNSSSIVYDIIFSESVTDFALGDLSKSGTGSASCTIGAPSGSGTTYTVTLTGCSQGTVILTMAANAAQNAVPQYVPSANTNASTVTIDQTEPTISSVSAPANRTYIPSDTPTFTVAFSESVTITGTPRLSLQVGGVTRYANYLSVSDSKTALFRYTVSASDAEFDLNGISLSPSLFLNSGTIQDLATNDMTSLLFTAPILTSVLVAQPAAAPTIDSVTASNGQLAIYFTSGADRGAATSNYQYSTNNGGVWSTRSPVATTSPLIITGLSNGTGYALRIRAVTSAGNSESSTAVTETPTVVSVTGNTSLLLSYGSSASTSSYSATGGTNSFTWSLGSSLTGITLSGTTVTAGPTTPVGTYTLTVRATDGGGQVGTKTLTITVVSGVSTVGLSLAGGVTTPSKGEAINIVASVDQAGKITILVDGKRITGCFNKSVSVGNVTCSWKPAVQKQVNITARLVPTNSVYNSSSSSLKVLVVRRTGTR